MKRLRFLCSLFLLTLIAAGISPAQRTDAAEGDGVYTVTLNRYFLDPQTGLSGWGTSENEAIGQGMVESAVSDTGLLEIVDGHYYLTVRIVLAGSVSNTSFGVRDAGGSDYYAVTAYCTQDNTAANNTIDYCFEIPDLNCTAAGFMYVEKMATDVVFFVTPGATTPGSGDFAVTFYTEQSAQTTTDQTQTTTDQTQTTTDQTQTSTDQTQTTTDQTQTATDQTQTSTNQTQTTTTTTPATAAPAAATSTPTAAPTVQPTATSTPTVTPAATPSAAPTATPKATATAAPTVTPAATAAEGGVPTGLIAGLVVVAAAAIAAVVFYVKKRKGANRNGTN